MIESWLGELYIQYEQLRESFGQSGWLVFVLRQQYCGMWLSWMVLSWP